MEELLTKKEFLGFKQEILEAIHRVTQYVDVKVDGVHAQLVEAIHHFSGEMDSQMGDLRSRLTRVETTISTLPTKAYMDDKFADEGVRYGGLIRESTEKTHALADALVAEGSLTREASSRITAMPPFPRRARRS